MLLSYAPPAMRPSARDTSSWPCSGRGIPDNVSAQIADLRQLREVDPRAARIDRRSARWPVRGDGQARASVGRIRARRTSMLVRQTSVFGPARCYDRLMGIYERVVGCVLAAAACLACSGGGTSAEPSTPPATPEVAPQVQSILQHMRERYRSARTYSDEGTFRSVSRGPKGDVVGTFTARFRTRWSAPDRLRFEFHEDPSEFAPARLIAVWTPRTGVTKSWFLDEERDDASLDAALGALQGVSHRTTGLVPRWLYEGGCKCVAQYELRGKTSCGRSTCFEMAGAMTPERRVTLFVDISNYALRKVVWRSKLLLEPIPSEYLDRVPPEQRERLRATLEAHRNDEEEDTMEIEPTFDGPMEATAFDFKPPPAAKTP